MAGEFSIPFMRQIAARAPEIRYWEILNEANLNNIRALNAIAERRGQTLAQMALAWALRDPRMTSLVIGASRPEQLRQNVAALQRLDFTTDELAEIDRHATDGDVDLWRAQTTL